MEREFVEVNPEVWKPVKEGDSIEGTLKEKKKEVGINKSNAYTLENEGKQSFIWGSTVLDDRMSFVNVGDFCRITFKGKEENKKGQPVNIYKVEKAKEEESLLGPMGSPI